MRRLCQWVQPADPHSGGEPGTNTPADPTASSPADPTTTTPGGDTVYDGTEVRVRLWRDGVDTPLTTLTVASGGAWSGTVRLPDAAQLTTGDYQLFAKCVIDRPELDGVRTYDFDPLPFTVVEAPPPTTVVTTPVELVPPITAVNPVRWRVRSSIARHRDRRGRELGDRGRHPAEHRDGTLETTLAGLGALLVGAAALWWGARARARARLGRPRRLTGRRESRACRARPRAVAAASLRAPARSMRPLRNSPINGIDCTSYCCASAGSSSMLTFTTL